MQMYGLATLTYQVVFSAIGIRNLVSYLGRGFCEEVLRAPVWSWSLCSKVCFKIQRVCALWCADKGFRAGANVMCFSEGSLRFGSYVLHRRYSCGLGQHTEIDPHSVELGRIRLEALIYEWEHIYHWIHLNEAVKVGTSNTIYSLT